MPKKIKLKNGNEVDDALSDKTILMDSDNTKNGVFSSYIHSTDPEEVMKQVFTDDKKIYINKLKQLSITELTIIAESLKIENYESMHTQEMVYQILRNMQTMRV